VDSAEGGDGAAPDPLPPADSPTARGRWWWPGVVLGSLVVGGLVSAMTVAILYANGEEPIASLSRHGLVLSTLGLGVLFSLILMVVVGTDSSGVTSDEKAPEAKDSRPGRHRRDYQPPRVADHADEVLASQLKGDQWRTVAGRLHRRRGPTVVRRLVMLPVIAVGTAVTLVLAGRDWLEVLPDSFVNTVGPWIGLLVALWYLSTEVSDLRAVWRGQMLLVRGVIGDVEDAALSPGPDPQALTGDLAEAASGIEHASVVVAVPRIDLLHPDGRLETAPPSVYVGIYTAEAPTDGSPRKVRLRCSRKTAKRLHNRDHVALLCLGDKRVAVRLRDLADPGTRAEDPPPAAAAPGPRS